MKMIFMGTPHFAVSILESLIDGKEYEIVGVITSPDKPVGRKQELTPPPVKTAAQKNSISVLQPERIKNPDFAQKIKDLNPDIIVVAAYGKIIPADILSIPKNGCVNIHASLLPKYRGPAPIQAAIIEGEKETGITIMLMDEKMDTGPTLSQRSIVLDPQETAETLHNKLSKLGADLLADTLPKYLRKEIQPQPQDDSLASYCKMITREDGKLIWNKSSKELDRQVRAFTPWPGTFAFYNIQPNKRIKITKVEVYQKEVATPDNSECPYGKIIFLPDTLLVKTGDGWLSLLEVQLEGGQLMNAKDFMNGHQNMNGIILK